LGVPGAAKLIYCSCCRVGTWQGNSCLSWELQNCSTAAAVDSVLVDGSSCVAGAANLCTAECCSLALELEVPCLSRELQTWSAVALVLDGASCLLYSKRLWLWYLSQKRIREDSSLPLLGASRFVASVNTVAYVLQEYRIRVDRY